MDDAAVVSGGDRLGQGEGDGQETVELNPAGNNELGQRRPFDELHGVEEGVFEFLDGINRDDVGVAQGGDRPRFALQEGSALGRQGRAFGQELDGDVAVETQVAGFPDDSHPAFADFLSQAVMPQNRIRRQIHGGKQFNPSERASARDRFWGGSFDRMGGFGP